MLLRYGHYLALVLGIVLTAWFWENGAIKSIFLFFVPGTLIFVFLPQFLQATLHAHCPCCSTPIRITEKERPEGVHEYIYRCHACTQQYPTGVFFKRDVV